MELISLKRSEHRLPSIGKEIWKIKCLKSFFLYSIQMTTFHLRLNFYYGNRLPLPFLLALFLCFIALHFELISAHTFSFRGFETQNTPSHGWKSERKPRKGTDASKSLTHPLFPGSHGLHQLIVFRGWRINQAVNRMHSSEQIQGWRSWKGSELTTFIVPYESIRPIVFFSPQKPQQCVENLPIRIRHLSCVQD